MQPERRFTTDSPVGPNRYSSAIALAGLYGTAICSAASTAGVNIALALILLATVLAWQPFWEDCRRLSVVGLMVLLTTYVAIHSLVFTRAYPELAECSNPHWTHVLLIAGLVTLPIAWWLYRFPKHLPLLLAAVGLGLAIGLLREIEFKRLAVQGISARHAWGTPPGQVSYLSAIGLCGCIAFSLRTWLGRHSPAIRLAATAGSIIVGCGFLLVLYGSQTRSVWFAAALVIGFYLLFMAWLAARNRRGVLPALGTIAVVGAMVATVAALDESTWEQRLKNHEQIVDAVLSLDPKAIMQANHSLGARVEMWIAGAQAVREKPVFGWGVGSKQLIMKQAPRSRRTGHFHNLYLELATGLGLSGLLLFIAVYTLLARNLLNQLRQFPLDPVAHTAAMAFAISLLVAFFEIRIGHPAGRTVWMLVVALLTMYTLRAKHQHENTVPS